MAGEQKFAAVDSSEPTDAQQVNPPYASSGEARQTDFDEFVAEPDATLARRHWIGPAVAVLALAGWTAFFVWANFSAMAITVDSGIWTSWIGTWATPALLIGVAWLILMRSSRRETRRFGDASRVLAMESERLEDRLLTINRELSLAREFISAQARDLDSVGRIAVDRLSQHAERLQTLVQENSAQVETIGTVSAAALENMERLRSQLPVLTTAAKDVTNNFGNAGRAASAQLEELITGFNRLIQSGQVSEKLVVALRGQFDQAMDNFGTRTRELDQTFNTRVQALGGQAEHFRTTLLNHQAEFDAQLHGRHAALTSEIAETRLRLDQEEAESIVSLRSRLAALRDETTAIARAMRDGEGAALAGWREAVTRLDQDMRAAADAADQIGQQAAATSNTRMARLAEEAAALERVLSETGARFETETARRRHSGEAQDRGMVERLAAQLAVLDEEIDRRQAAQSAHLTALITRGEAATAQLVQIEGRIAAIAETGGAAEAGMTQRLDVLGQRLGESRQQLDATDHTLAGLTDSSVRLLELIQGAAAHSREDLAQAIETGVARLGDLEAHALLLRETVIDADRSGASLSTHLQIVHDRLDAATGSLSAWHEDINAKAGSHAQTLDGLKLSLAQLDSQTIATASRVQDELAAAIRQLDESAGAALDKIEQRGTASISVLAEQLGAESGDAIERAMRLQVSEISGKLEQAAAHAAGISREAASQLREQLAKVNELVGNLETRVEKARVRAEERVDDDFARRVALITEALNSNAIDIAKALDTDVSDTAWSAYLRGDRGIFTRRAVRLLDPPEARGILQLYQNDSTFSEYVSHYIHDFEAMLRQVLSTRDGHAMGVTLLSSDMGKLYVVLAQAIERLRN
jgi:hypothetical protein